MFDEVNEVHGQKTVFLLFFFFLLGPVMLFTVCHNDSSIFRAGTHLLLLIKFLFRFIAKSVGLN